MSFVGASDAGNAVERATESPVDAPTQSADLRTAFTCVTWTDQELVFAAPAARDAAFVELFRRYSGSVAAVARMVLGSASSGCDDVVADVFAGLWRAPERFDPDRGSLLGLLRLQARGRSLDLLRSESNRQRREQRAASRATRGPSIESALIATETGDKLRRALSLLPDAERTAIELAYFEGLSYRAVAARLEVPEGTVKSRIRSGLRRLRNEVDIEDCFVISIATDQADSPTHRRGFGTHE